MSEGLEHGYEDMPKLQQRSADCRDDLATAIRRALFELLQVDSDVAARLQSPPFDRPHRRDPVSRGVTMTLRGPVDSLAPPGETHPLLNTQVEVQRAVLRPDGTGDLTFREQIDFKSGGATAEDIQRFASDRAIEAKIESVEIRRAEESPSAEGARSNDQNDEER